MVCLVELDTPYDDCRAVLKVEDSGLEPLTFWLPAKRSPN